MLIKGTLLRPYTPAVRSSWTPRPAALPPNVLSRWQLRWHGNGQSRTPVQASALLVKDIVKQKILKKVVTLTQAPSKPTAQPGQDKNTTDGLEATSKKEKQTRQQLNPQSAGQYKVLRPYTLRSPVAPTIPRLALVHLFGLEYAQVLKGQQMRVAAEVDGSWKGEIGITKIWLRNNPKLVESFAMYRRNLDFAKIEGLTLVGWKIKTDGSGQLLVMVLTAPPSHPLWDRTATTRTANLLQPHVIRYHEVLLPKVAAKQLFLPTEAPLSTPTGMMPISLKLIIPPSVNAAARLRVGLKLDLSKGAVGGGALRWHGQLKWRMSSALGRESDKRIYFNGLRPSFLHEHGLAITRVTRRLATVNSGGKEEWDIELTKS